MLLKTILNHVQPCKSFCYESAEFGADCKCIVVQVVARKNSRPICSECGEKGPGYDRLETRRYQFIPLWNMPVFFAYAPRRVDCGNCGVKVERVPWSEGKSRLCTVYIWFLAAWAKLISWKQVGQSYGASWSTVYRSVSSAVLWGMEHRSLDGVESIGVDEVAWRKGHGYMTLVYQIDEGKKRLLYACEGRTKSSMIGFFRELGQERSEKLKYVCSDMWKPYLSVIDRYCTAVNVLDRFHIMKKMNEAIDEMRREEMRKAKESGYETVLKNSRWVLLKRKENLTKKEVVKLKELMEYNLAPVKGRILREEFQQFWEYRDEERAMRFMRDWCAQVMRTDLEPMKAVARMLLNHERLLMNWFKAKGELSSGSVEGMNLKVKLAMRKSYGFRGVDVAKTAFFHQLGNLPEPEFTHKFW